MNRILLRAISLVLILLPTLTTAGETMTEKDNVLKAITTMTSAFQGGDIETVMASYEPNATVVFELGSPIDDAQVLKAMFEGMAAVKPVFTYTGHDILVTGDIAVHTAPWTMKATAPSGDEISQSGLSVAVLRKQKDGAWKIVIDNPHGAALMN